MNTKFLAGGLLAFCLSTAAMRAQSPVTLQVDLAHPGRAMPPDFCGLSYEIKLVLPNAATGKHFFSPDHAPLISTFKTLGIKHLRVGGNTAERATIPVPGTPDIDSLFAFANAADIKVIYTVRMEGNSPAAAAGVAKYVMDHYRDRVSCLTVGNEPDKPWKYPAYLEEWKKFTAVILSPEYVPDAKFCGPSARQQAVQFARLFANDMGGWDHLAFLTQHFYARGDGNKVTDADSASARARLLSPDLYQVYQKFYDAFVPAAKAKGAGYRLEEGNSYSLGGAIGASDTFTASLWSVDFLYWWAWHDALGINFHSGEKVPRGLPGPDKPNIYTALTSSPKGIEVLPLGYGLKLFNLGSQGRLVPVNVASNPDNVNLAVYGTFTSDRTLRITILNKEFGPTGRPAKLVIDSGLPGARGKIIFMSAPDIAAVKGVAIGGAEITEDGAWNGTWSDLPAASPEGSVTIIVPAASACVIELPGK
jgi:hypothetical protein